MTDENFSVVDECPECLDINAPICAFCGVCDNCCCCDCEDDSEENN